jgi:alpha-glucoside transport system substrate-binding protein
MTVRVGRKTATVAAIGALSLVLAACGGGDEGGGTTEETGAAGGGGTTSDLPPVDCSVYEQFGDLSGTSVTTFAGIGDPESGYYETAWATFEECTGVDVVPEWTQDFEAQIVVRVQSGNAPDIAILPQPGLLATLVRDTGAVLPGFEEVEALVDENWSEDWKGYGSVDGTFYAAPNSSNSKSFVWYSPSAFEEAGYTVPTTWEEMIELSDQIVADNPGSTTKPWCAGIESGVATGWTATDWMEDVMLREFGPDVYDQWYTHEIPFNDPQVLTVLEKVGTILKNEEYVNGGIGGVQTIATTEFQEGGIPITQGTCFLHRQASFYVNFWPEGTTIAEDGDVFAFYLPPNEGSADKPVLVGSEFITAFEDRPEVRAFATFLATSDYANVRAAVPGEAGGFVSANLGLDPANLANPIDKLTAEQFQDPEAIIRFDASDLMPGAVGSGSFWTEMTNWIANDKPDQEVLDAIEASWPD